jgi:hypothetical protein
MGELSEKLINKLILKYDVENFYYMSLYRIQNTGL